MKSKTGLKKVQRAGLTFREMRLPGFHFEVSAELDLNRLKVEAPYRGEDGQRLVGKLDRAGDLGQGKMLLNDEENGLKIIFSCNRLNENKWIQLT